MLTSAQKALIFGGISSTVAVLIEIILLRRMFLSENMKTLDFWLLNIQKITILICIIAAIYFGVRAIKNKDGKMWEAILGIILAVLPLVIFLILALLSITLILAVGSLPPGTSL